MSSPVVATCWTGIPLLAFPLMSGLSSCGAQQPKEGGKSVITRTSGRRQTISVEFRSLPETLPSTAKPGRWGHGKRVMQANH